MNTSAMQPQQLVLSCFPGIGLLDMAFEEAGFCVVRGPDLIWGGNIKRFHPPAGKFDGIIGGPPCQAFSPLKNMNPKIDRFGNMIPEFERVVAEAQPTWFLMENVRGAPVPMVESYGITDRLINNRWCGGTQNRLRRFSFGWRRCPNLSAQPVFQVVGEVFEPIEWKATVTAAHAGERRTHFNKSTGGKIQNYTVAEALDAQGLPSDFFANSPLTRIGQLRALAQGVPLPMGRAVAQAVKDAIGVAP